MSQVDQETAGLVETMMASKSNKEADNNLRAAFEGWTAGIITDEEQAALQNAHSEVLSRLAMQELNDFCKDYAEMKKED